MNFEEDRLEPMNKLRPVLPGVLQILHGGFAPLAHREHQNLNITWARGLVCSVERPTYSFHCCIKTGTATGGSPFGPY